MVLEETLERGWAWEVLESGPGAPPGTISGQRNRRCTAIWGGPLRISASIPEPLGSPLQSQLQEPDSPTGSLGCLHHRAAPAAGGGPFKEASATTDLLLWLFRVSQAAAVTGLTATGQLSN